MMTTNKETIGNWQVECQPDDGARISVLKYLGYNLFTTVPTSFKLPDEDYGEYENRPVYGYDDCFPTVEECRYPNENFGLKDHGDVCWQSWNVNRENGKLICTTDLTNPMFRLIRILDFKGNMLKWHFEVINRSGKVLPFIHVMHPLMPLLEIKTIEISEFGKVYSETNSVVHEFANSKMLNAYLQNIPVGSFEMLFIRNVRVGTARLHFKNGMQMKIDYDINLFPTTGIWWNNGGYPDAGIRRTEFAVEPIPGSCSNLEKTFRDGFFLKVKPREAFNWTINWTME
jgi:hypothetical protein